MERIHQASCDVEARNNIDGRMVWVSVRCFGSCITGYYVLRQYVSAD